MLPPNYKCTGCSKVFSYAFHGAHCYLKVGLARPDGPLSDADLLAIPLRPAWCKDCAILSVAEDIAPVRAFEDAYGAVRAGRPVEYPLETHFMEAEQAQEQMSDYLRWRLDRRHSPRALCCGGSNYQPMDVPQPLFKHADCDSGVIEPAPSFSISGGTYRRPPAGTPANIRLYSSEGVLLGNLHWSGHQTLIWDVSPAEYSRSEED